MPESENGYCPGLFLFSARARIMQFVKYLPLDLWGESDIIKILLRNIIVLSLEYVFSATLESIET